MSRTPPPENAQDIITEIQLADITVDDWIHPILLNRPELPEYWRGYFERYCQEVWESMASGSENFRTALICHLQDCWD